MSNQNQTMSNQPMGQFEYIGGYLTVVDTTRYNFAWGFRRVIGRIDDL